MGSTQLFYLGLIQILYGTYGCFALLSIPAEEKKETSFKKRTLEARVLSFSR